MLKKKIAIESLVLKQLLFQLRAGKQKDTEH